MRTMRINFTQLEMNILGTFSENNIFKSKEHCGNIRCFFLKNIKIIESGVGNSGSFFFLPGMLVVQFYHFNIFNQSTSNYSYPCVFSRLNDNYPDVAWNTFLLVLNLFWNIINMFQDCLGTALITM